MTRYNSHEHDSASDTRPHHNTPQHPPPPPPRSTAFAFFLLPSSKRQWGCCCGLSPPRLDASPFSIELGLRLHALLGRRSLFALWKLAHRTWPSKVPSPPTYFLVEFLEGCLSCIVCALQSIDARPPESNELIPKQVMTPFQIIFCPQFLFASASGV